MHLTNDVGVRSQGPKLCSNWHINTNKAEVILMNSKYDLWSEVERSCLGQAAAAWTGTQRLISSV